MVGLFCKNQVMAQSLSVPGYALGSFYSCTNMNEDLFKVLCVIALWASSFYYLYESDWSHFHL